MRTGTNRLAVWFVVVLGAAGAAGGVLASGSAAPGETGWPSYAASIEPAAKGQADIIARREHCSADADRLAAIGRAVGQQVRIYRDDSHFALFTVTEARDEEPDTVVRLGRIGRARLGSPGPAAARVVAMGPHPTLSDDEAKRLGECVERLDDDGRAAGLLILAPHGGGIEQYTDLEAQRVAAALAGKGKGVATWQCKGWSAGNGQGASTRWHITSTEISEASFPKLAQVAGRRFDHAVSFHGMAREAILIGGGGPPELKQAMQAEIGRALEGSGIPVLIGKPGDANGGIHPRNIVNRYCQGTGIQIEQSSRARREYWKPIADAVARVYASRL
jgi:phage replication-related protein YjqB (UPF0714/DUF867 family)